MGGIILMIVRDAVQNLTSYESLLLLSRSAVSLNSFSMKAVKLGSSSKSSFAWGSWLDKSSLESIIIFFSKFSYWTSILSI